MNLKTALVIQYPFSYFGNLNHMFQTYLPLHIVSVLWYLSPLRNALVLTVDLVEHTLNIAVSMPTYSKIPLTQFMIVLAMISQAHFLYVWTKQGSVVLSYRIDRYCWILHLKMLFFFFGNLDLDILSWFRKILRQHIIFLWMYQLNTEAIP